MTFEQLTAKANLLKNRIEADHYAAGNDPTMADLPHPLNAQWLDVQDEIRERITAAFRR